MAFSHGLRARALPPGRLRVLPTRTMAFGFFLEYDRGTEKPGQYAAKLATYYRYRNSGAYRRDYESFPTLLVVTTSDAAEARFTHQAYLAQQRYGGMPLVMFLTTEGRMQVHPEGALGPIWRSPGRSWTAERSARMDWLPGLIFARSRSSRLFERSPESSHF